ncbi:hypothetical protein GCM10010517_07090 [Streptosporangium fragile]|uniref:Phosphatidic acid phosphatase type 2/haloperoxidase domain-containing protein n=1 Tax=Streptosporangium fragile TaxID=46186 RepID=A0ABN3VR47_9ACTN
MNDAINIEDVPDVSAEWYRDVTEFARDTPSWSHGLAELGTEAVIVLLAALLVWAWWRARRQDARAMAAAVIGPVAVVVVYLLSEVLKNIVQEERPCRAVPGVAALAPCPEYGDWSFPSNHSVLAAGAAAVLLLAWRRATLPLLALAVLAAFSRVYLGVHYPHDVAAGFLLGVVAAPLLVLLLTPPLTPLVDRLRGQALWRPLLGGTGAVTAEAGWDRDPRARPHGR